MPEMDTELRVIGGIQDAVNKERNSADLDSKAWRRIFNYVTSLLGEVEWEVIDRERDQARQAKLARDGAKRKAIEADPTLSEDWHVLGKRTEAHTPTAEAE